MQAMLDQNIATRRGVMCAHRERAYPAGTWSCTGAPRDCGCAPGSCRKLAQSEEAQDLSIVLPLYHDMTGAEQDAVVAALRAALRPFERASRP
jgi:dTDP-4-amino-4,6-dideoxygalactose transaminase